MIVSETQRSFIEKGINDGISYAAYRALVKTMAQEGRSTGIAPDETRIQYTKLNDKRMDRLDKTLKISPEATKIITAFTTPITWLVVTESWCGDAAQTLPMIQKVADLNSNIDVKIIFRDENEALMHYFFEGAMAIPKLLMIDNSTKEVVYTWGARPSKATAIVEAFKRKHGALTAEFKQDLQMWYNRDKGKNTLEDLLEILR